MQGTDRRALEVAIFTGGEIDRRLDALRSDLGTLDCAVIASFHNTYYLSGHPMVPWGRMAIVIVPADGDATVVLPNF